MKGILRSHSNETFFFFFRINSSVLLHLVVRGAYTKPMDTLKFNMHYITRLSKNNLLSDWQAA